jgi:ribonuclease HI
MIDIDISRERVRIASRKMIRLSASSSVSASLSAVLCKLRRAAPSTKRRQRQRQTHSSSARRLVFGGDARVTEGPMTQIYTDASVCGRDRLGVGVYIESDHAMNLAARTKCPPHHVDSNYSKLLAILLALLVQPWDAHAQVNTGSDNCLQMLRQHREGGAKPKYAALVQAIRAAIAERRSCEASTVIHKVKGHSGVPGNVTADRLARVGADMSASSGPHEILRGVHAKFFGSS